MLSNRLKIFRLVPLFCLTAVQLFALADRFRIIWQHDPAHAAVIAWDQVSGDNPTIHLDINDFGDDIKNYSLVKKPTRIHPAKGMNNHFVRLKNLLPGRTYYFIVRDSEGQSRQMFFTTAPDTPDKRISIIAGGDSRNYRDARQEANILVGKLRPHCVMFGGDFTAGDSADEWKEWLDDWQLTIANDGRITPIIPARGNHEESNQTLNDIFDIAMPNAYYAVTLGGDLLRIYTLNSMIPVGGAQRDWIENDMRANAFTTWKVAQYHHPMRPHTQKKAEKHDQIVNWAPLFFQFGMNLVVECDAHVVKATFPIRPAKGDMSEEGFVRDDQAGTVFIGEGCWGAPLRRNNDNKSWTRASGSFNQFHWIFVNREKIEIRFVKTDGASQVADIDPDNIFKPPRGLVIWSPPTGDVVTIKPRSSGMPGRGEEILAARSGFELRSTPELRPAPNTGKQSFTQHNIVDETSNWDACPMLMAESNVKVKYALQNKSTVVIRIINNELQEVSRVELINQAPGEYLKTLPTDHLPEGRFLAVIKENDRIIARYRLLKK